MAARYVSDTARANWSSMIAGVVGVVATGVVLFARDELIDRDLGLAVTYFVMWRRSKARHRNQP